MTHLGGGICCLQSLDDQDTFPCLYGSLYGLAWPCIYSMCKNCRAVCIYNNTACSQCVCALHGCLDVAVRRFICWSVIGSCLSAPSFRGIFLPVTEGICNDGAVGLCKCVFVSVYACVHCHVRVSARLRSDHYDWAVSLFFTLNDPAQSKLHRGLLHHCA